MKTKIAEELGLVEGKEAYYKNGYDRLGKATVTKITATGQVVLTHKYSNDTTQTMRFDARGAEMGASSFRRGSLISKEAYEKRISGQIRDREAKGISLKLHELSKVGANTIQFLPLWEEVEKMVKKFHNFAGE